MVKVDRQEPIDMKNGPLHRFFRYMNLGYTFIYGLDPQILYKPASLGSKANEAKYRLYCSPQLRQSPGKLDQWRHSWHRFKLALLVYFLLRYSSTMLMTLAFYKYPRRRKQIAQWHQWLGNPMGALPQALLVMYGAQLVTLVQTLGFMAHNLSVKRPIDWVNNRILLDPTRELARIDLVIREQLDELLAKEATKSHHQQQCERQKQLTERTRKLVERLGSDLGQMRPAIYTNHWHQQMSFYLPIRAFAMFTALFTISIFILIYFCTSAWEYKCRILWGRNDCNFTETFTWQDTLAIAELLLGFVLVVGALGITNLGAFYCSSSQKLLIGDLRSELDDLLRSLMITSPLNQMKEEDEDELDCRLLNARIHFKLVDMDFRKCNEFMGEILKPQLLFVSTTIMLSISIYPLEQNQFRDRMVASIVPLWLATNLMLIACSNWHSAALKLHPLAWSIMAQIHRRFQFRVASLRRPKLVRKDFVSSAWLHLVLSKRFGQNWSSVRLWGISITYTKIIQLNFFLLSFAALLRSLA